MSSELLNDIKAKPIVLLAAIALHVVLIIMLSINLSSSEVHRPASTTKKTVKAVVVDAAKVEAEAKKLQQAEEDKKRAEQKRLKQEQDAAKKKIADEKKRLDDIKKKQANEKKRLEELKKKNLAEKKRIEEEKKKADIARQKAETEKKKQQELEARRKADEEQRRKDEAAELQRKLAEEERLEKEAQQAAENNKRLQSLRSQYVHLIEQKVERNWLRPATSTSEMSCEVIVTQTSLGDVVDVSLRQCTNDLAFQRSIERAVRKASPLPPPPDPKVFDREIHFTFRPRS